MTADLDLEPIRARAEAAIDELTTEDELCNGFRSRNGDFTMQEGIAAIRTLLDEVDRLRGVVAQAKADGWDDAHAAFNAHFSIMGGGPVNPYRAEGGN